MINRKQFLKNTSLTLAGIAALPSIIKASNNSESDSSNKILLVLDGIRKDDLEVLLLPKLVEKNDRGFEVFNNLTTLCNVDFHSESAVNACGVNNYRTFDVSINSNIYFSRRCMVITGFDVAHYNYYLYQKRVKAAIADILYYVENNQNQTFVIMSSMGRNHYHNSITDVNGVGGLDHNHESAKECWGIKIEPRIIGENAIKINNTRLYTHQLAHNIYDI